MSWSRGNPGAASFLMQVAVSELQYEDKEIIFDKLQECEAIRGTNLYVLYSDLCKKDMQKVLTLAKNCPRDILEDACSRQDYSGVKLVEPYLETQTEKSDEV